MQKQRLVYRVVLKLMTFVAALVLLVVFINSLFTGSGDDKDISRDKIATIDLSGMVLGEIRKARWQGREVAVLKRKAVEPEKHKTTAAILSGNSIINPVTRSILPAYFVYFNTGDSGNCPLFFEAGRFKDICSGNYFDVAGRAINASNHAAIKIPPHYFEQQGGEPAKVLIGRWKEVKPK